MVLRVPKVTKDIKEHQELTLVKVLKVMMEHKVLKDIRDKTELMLVKVLKEMTVLKVLLEHKDIRVIKVDYQHMQFHLVQFSSGLVQQMLFHQVGLYVMVRIILQT